MGGKICSHMSREGSMNNSSREESIKNLWKLSVACRRKNLEKGNIEMFNNFKRMADVILYVFKMD